MSRKQKPESPINRTLYRGDNLDIMRGMNTATVDLIATDPPFNKGKDFHATPESLAKGAQFHDRWNWDRDVHQEWVESLATDWPELKGVIEGAYVAHSEGMAAFICYMAVRLIEMKRILKLTGSIYLHCDPTASHYLKAAMDSIFGARNFRNEIVWGYRKMGAKANCFMRNHDIILFYSRGEKATFNPPRGEPTPESLKTYESGRRVGYVANHSKKIVTVFSWEKYRAAVAAGKLPQGMNEKEFTDGKPLMGSWWTDIKILGGPGNKERTGYPTQKPVVLYERIIQASSNKGDLVLDPFCGCATTLVAADNLERQWVGIDLWQGAYKIVVNRMRTKVGVLGKIRNTDIPPTRTDGKEAAAPELPTFTRKGRTAPRMTREEIKRKLIEAQNGQYVCQGCYREFDSPEYLDTDHIRPKTDGGTDDIENRCLLCGPCNRRKGCTLTLSGLRKANQKIGFMNKRDKNAPRKLPL